MQITIDTEKDSLPTIINLLTALDQLNRVDITSSLSPINLPTEMKSPAPSTNPPPPPPSSSGVEGEPGQLTDSAGALWDPEIHTANQSKNSDGTWRRKRTKPAGADEPKTVQLPKVPPPPQSEPAPAVPPAPEATRTPAPESVVPPAPSAPPPSDEPFSFGDLVKLATTLVGNKKMTTTQIIECCTANGVPDLYACQNNLAVIPAVRDAILAKAPK